MLTTRRYDIDWLRVIAIGLLLLYHVAIGFQPWGTMIGFIVNKNPWTSLWIPMSMLNVWRIPLLFFVSGMGVYFAMQKRNWKQLITERAGRILIPFIFGMFFIVPVHIYFWQSHYNIDPSYTYDPGHLWFLRNIFIYVVVLSPVFFYLKRNQHSQFVTILKKVLANPLGFVLVAAAFIVEVLVVKPYPFELYATTWHGFYLGLVAFFFGFCFVLAGRPFWDILLKWRWVYLALAVILFTLRLAYLKINTPGYLLAIESLAWIFTVLAFGHRYLNRPGKTLTYLSQAAYPVYIVHMIFLYLGSRLIFPLNIPVPLQFALVLIFTFAGCFAFYEFLIRRVNFIRPLFGLKIKKEKIGVAQGIESNAVI